MARCDRRARLCLTFCLLIAAPAGAAQPALEDYVDRLEGFREQIPALVASADDFGARLVERPEALLNVAWDGQEAFSEEMINRAGGLAHAYPTEASERAPRATEHDVVLYSVRSWEKDGDEALERLAHFREEGWPVTLIASEAGRPDELDELEIEHFIDNGAPDGSAAHGRINLLANVTLGWMWTAEYVAAMTRRGKLPAILISVAYDRGVEHNRPLQTPEGRHTQVDCDEPIEAEESAETYLSRIEQLVEELRSQTTQSQIADAADAIVERIDAGETVGLTGVGHIILHEADVDNRSPFRAFRARGRGNPFERYLEPGEVALYIAYLGMNSRHHDYMTPVREAGVELVTSYVSAEDEELNHPDPVAHVEQHWELGDTVVPLECHPDGMAPISGVNAGLLHRMIDDAVHERLNGD